MKNYDLYFSELEEFYREIESLFLFKESLLEEYLMKCDNESDISVMDYILTKKIVRMME